MKRGAERIGSSDTRLHKYMYRHSVCIALLYIILESHDIHCILIEMWHVKYWHKRASELSVVLRICPSQITFVRFLCYSRPYFFHQIKMTTRRCTRSQILIKRWFVAPKDARCRIEWFSHWFISREPCHLHQCLLRLMLLVGMRYVYRVRSHLSRNK